MLTNIFDSLKIANSVTGNLQTTLLVCHSRFPFCLSLIVSFLNSDRAASFNPISTTSHRSHSGRGTTRSHRRRIWRKSTSRHYLPPTLLWTGRALQLHSTGKGRRRRLDERHDQFQRRSKQFSFPPCKFLYTFTSAFICVIVIVIKFQFLRFNKQF